MEQVQHLPSQSRAAVTHWAAGFHEGGSAGRAGASLAGAQSPLVRGRPGCCQVGAPGCGDCFAGTLHDVLIRQAVLGRGHSGSSLRVWRTPTYRGRQQRDLTKRFGWYFPAGFYPLEMACFDFLTYQGFKIPYNGGGGCWQTFSRKSRRDLKAMSLEEWRMYLVFEIHTLAALCLSYLNVWREAAVGGRCFQRICTILEMLLSV